jgi:hypothetical protein
MVAIFLLAISSWFALYLEIARYHHVQVAHLGAILWPADGPIRPGVFVRAVVGASLLVPLPLGLVLLWQRRTRANDRPSGLVSRVAIVFGAALFVFGLANQVVRRPEFTVDLTLRTGNGGFLLLGLVCLAIGFAARQRDPSNVLA